jgi:hypothetical protein
MDYNVIGIKLNLYWNNYSIQTMQAKQMKSNEITRTSSLHSYLQTSIKGNSRCNTPLTLTITCKYATSSLVHFKSRTKSAHIPTIGNL